MAKERSRRLSSGEASWSLDDEMAKVTCIGDEKELINALQSLAHHHPGWFTKRGGLLPLRFAKALEVSSLAPWYVRPAVSFLIRIMQKGLWHPTEPRPGPLGPTASEEEP